MTVRMGATLSGVRCEFRLWAPNAVRVAVTGSFNDWRRGEHFLHPDGDGVWSIALDGIHAGDEYLYVIDNRGGDAHNPGHHDLFRIDPWARATRDANGNGVIVDVAAELVASGLDSDPFVTPAGADWLIYQAHVGSFSGMGDDVDTGPTGTGTFAQFEQKLPYIRSLGFNAIALLPIHQNPGDGNEGYAPAHLFAPESSFGSPLALRRLIRAAHDIGLAVIFDVVWNHMTDTDNRLWDFDGMTKDGGVFFEGGERTPWGPRLAFWKHEVREFIVDNARMCFEEYHVDGLRIDAADEIARDVLAAVMTTVRAEERSRRALMIAEWTGNESHIWEQLTEELRFDRIWALTDPLLFRSAVDAQHASDPADRTAHLLRLIELPGAASRIRYLLGSHDNAHDNEGGERSGYRHFVEIAGGRDHWHARAKARMGWALSVALPGTPMCFMGAECLQPGYWHPRLDANAAHDDHRFDWRRCEDGMGLEMRQFVTDTNSLWWRFPTLRESGIQIVHTDHDNGVVAFQRAGAQGNSILAVINVSESGWPDHTYRVPVPKESRTWRVILDSQAPAYGGDALSHAEELVTDDGSLQLTLPRWSIVLLESN